MGLFDDLKMATGLGLDPAQAYRRAFEKGVLLGFSKFGEAAEMWIRKQPWSDSRWLRTRSDGAAQPQLATMPASGFAPRVSNVLAGSVAGRSAGSAPTCDA
jgi:hypothetical protein